MSRPSNNTGKRAMLWLVASALFIAACSGAEVTGDAAPSSSAIASSTTVPLVETTTTATATATKVSDDAALAAVLSALDAKNSFDLDRWLAAHEGGERQGIPLFAEQILMNAKQQWEIVEPCQVTGQTSSGETMVSCLIQEVTGFWGIGGINDAKLQTFRVNADGLITNEFHFGSDRRNSFNRAFHQWLSDTYPDVYNELGYESVSSNGPGFDTRNPDHVLVAVEYVEEFVAQSDQYPLDPSD
jgi:hypothetical protein